MNKQTNAKFLIIAMAAIFLFGAATFTFAQDAAKFKVGDRIKIPDHDAPATIVKIEPGWLTVKYDDMNGNYQIM